jgi:acetate---CoA ligase (ADP-forming)
MFAGVTMDPMFGPLIACGFSGPIAELVGDMAFRLHPVTNVDEAEMIASLKASKLLDGYHDTHPGDREALVALLMRVSALAQAIPEMVELKLHPISVQPSRQSTIVLNARMRLETYADLRAKFG